MIKPSNKRVEYVIMCIGNIDGGDDAIGPFIAKKLDEERFDGLVLDCGTVPENFTSIIKKNNPKNLIIIDASDMGLDHGKIRIITKEKIGVMHISTHGIPISVIMNYLNQYVENMIFIGIQPLEMSGHITKVVRDSAEKLIKIIKNKDFSQIKTLE